MNKIIIGIIIAVILLVGIIWVARPNPQNNTASLSSVSDGSLSVQEETFDFGAISMAAGDVKHAFKIKNMGTGPVVISKMYTSCMCTTVALLMGDKKFGPYGMRGHGFIPKINAEFAPGEEAIAEVVFDPAAHGPAGIGKISRAITLETSSGVLEFQITASVTP